MESDSDQLGRFRAAENSEGFHECLIVQYSELGTEGFPSIGRLDDGRTD